MLCRLQLVLVRAVHVENRSEKQQAIYCAAAVDGDVRTRLTWRGWQSGSPTTQEDHPKERRSPIREQHKEDEQACSEHKHCVHGTVLENEGKDEDCNDVEDCTTLGPVVHTLSP